MKDIIVIDTEICNLISVYNSIKKVGYSSHCSKNHSEIKNASILVLPGVGSFSAAMENLEKLSLKELIINHVKKEKPILGICLGMQLLANRSFEDGEHEGLGLIEGEVQGLKSDNTNFKVPNYGWCDVYSKKDCILFPKNWKPSSFYHNHSFHFKNTKPKDCSGFIKYNNNEITVAIENKNVFGVQFHPEKSQDEGLELIKRFLEFSTSHNKC